MTAEVGVMNRFGIALAADSAVTVNVGESTGKVYTSAEKLFLLSESAPVGAMVYGAASLAGLPWETIIKVYRRSLNHSVFQTLEEYVDHFVEFLRSDGSMFPASAQSSFVANIAASFYGYVRQLLGERLESAIREHDTVTDQQIAESLGDVVAKELGQIREFELLDLLPEDFPTIVEKEYGEVIRAIRDQVFGSVPASSATREQLVQLVAELISREGFAGNESGVVIAGFGEDECFPRLSELYVKGIAANRILFKTIRKIAIGEDFGACVIPFAQREMVHAFMEGIDPDFQSLIYDSVKALFTGVSETIIEAVKRRDEQIGVQLESDVSEPLADLLKNLLVQWDSKRQSDYSAPIMNIVASLPKDELAAMAESLVNITKFKRRVSEQQETVGGPIDVVVITKGDGFVWISRKYYFKSDLNPRFMSRYYERR
jgi:hypothetical protein